ncbi:multiple epidermal growth factor-like domains protein 10 [Octopus sinensis]|uniref:Multiple epidermal growth factor-like domains protein 10 n=1 Tax=Octopus sinensis TaxID=2607531 RepID=A0A7E6FC23_9MOLL|nr:multiple epidermal growth factor-like domains protein 10 [Octopus sinensis]
MLIVSDFKLNSAITETAFDKWHQCPGGKYGTGCNAECSCRNNDVCDRVTGKCPHGCPPGFTSGTCKEACPKGTYGDNCSKTCHCIDDSCNPIYGQCAHGCVAGYQGINCQAFCDKGTYGLHCNKNFHYWLFLCFQVIVEDAPVFVKVVVVIFVGVVANWVAVVVFDFRLAVFLSRFCDKGTYGLHCNKTCNCIDDDNCNPIHGACPRGCATGYTGSDCQEQCSPGKYGSGCNEECNCRDKDVCDRVTGICPHGCPPGFTSGTCKEVCPKGTFGDKCHKQCHCNDDSCNPAYGHCAHGCVAGYRGKSCQECEYETTDYTIGIMK